MNLNKGLLKKYCNNTCTGEELNNILVWFEESACTSEGKALLFEIWDELPNESDNKKINFDLLLGRIHREINLAQTRKLLIKSKQNLIRYKKREYFIKIITRVAAVLMLPVFGFGLYMSARYQSAIANRTYNEVFSSVDAITKVTLPDGSNVWLNHSSSLKYPSIFQGNSRNVELNGEGYFEVVSNSKIPFIVNAGEIQIKALGTAFNIMAYPNEDRIETSLIKGRVELQRINANGKVIPIFTMKPSDLSTFQKENNKISTRIIHDDRYFSWKEGKLTFNEEPMNEVVKKLSRWFNVDIIVKDPELLNLTYTATFVSETLPQVMELMAMISPVSYSISNRQEISSGIFAKRKIILRYKDN